MFTGIVEEVGSIIRLTRGESYYRITVGAAGETLEQVCVGDSIAIDGVCQTVVDLRTDEFEVETLAVSLRKTTMATWRAGRRVNLERALTPSSRLGGHLVQGHVDGTAPITAIRRDGDNRYLSIDLPRSLSVYCVPEGSIAIDGVSLTIARLDSSCVTVNVVPHTWKHTTLALRRSGERVNVEVDLIGRYIVRSLERYGTRNTLSAEQLEAWGYI